MDFSTRKPDVVLVNTGDISGERVEDNWTYEFSFEDSVSFKSFTIESSIPSKENRSCQAKIMSWVPIHGYSQTKPCKDRFGCRGYYNLCTPCTLTLTTRRFRVFCSTSTSNIFQMFGNPKNLSLFEGVLLPRNAEDHARFSASMWSKFTRMCISLMFRERRSLSCLKFTRGVIFVWVGDGIMYDSAMRRGLLRGFWG